MELPPLFDTDTPVPNCTFSIKQDPEAAAALRQINSHPHAAKFWEAHFAAPEIFEALKEAALARRAAGFTRCAVKALVESVRWDHDLRVGPTGDGWKVNNTSAPLFARLLEAKCPELRNGFFEKRAVTSADQ